MANFLTVEDPVQLAGGSFNLCLSACALVIRVREISAGAGVRAQFTPHPFWALNPFRNTV